jgi:Protein of unknown function (DUF3141)
MIEATPPGLYEAVITDAGPNTANRNLVDGKYLFRLEKRMLDDIRVFGVNSPEDDARFGALARLSEINASLYRTFWQPWVRASVTERTAEAMRAMHPNRQRFGLFSDRNPLTQAMKPLTKAVRANRTPVSPDNPLLGMEKAASSWITTCLESWGTIRDSMTEAFFLHAYGSPLLQTMIGLGEPKETPRRMERDLLREAAAAELRSSLDRKFEEGGLEEAALRALIYVRLPDDAFDERSFRMLKSIREQRKSNDRITPSQFRDMLNVQLQLVRLDEERAIETVPKLLRGGEDNIAAAWSAMRQLVAAPGALDREGQRRWERIEKLFGAEFKPSRSRKVGNV